MPVLFFLLAFASSSAAAPPVPTVPAGTGAEGPLLSGYGGPGAGQQAILGSHLIHGGRGGGRGGGAGGSGTSGGGSTASSSGSAASAEGGAATSAPETTSGGEAGGAGAAAHGLPRSGGASHARGAGSSSHGGATPSRQVGSGESTVLAAQPLGLTSGDIVEILLIAFALTGAAVLTRTLARGER